MERNARTRTSRDVVRHSVSEAIRTSSETLPPKTLQSMERSFEHSFADVRVHADDVSPLALGARAYALQNDIVFAPGQYAPGTLDGDRLLAHELSHVVQHDRAPAPFPNLESLEVAAPDAASEVEAEGAANAIAAGESVSTLSASTAGILSPSLFDYIPLLGGLGGSPAQQLNDAPGLGTQSGPYVYGNSDGAKLGDQQLNGVSGGYGRGHAQGEWSWDNLFGGGDKATVKGQYDNEKAEGHFGAWSTPKDDGTTDTNIGAQASGKLVSASGEVAYKGPNGQSSFIGLDGNGPNFDVSSFGGTGGFNFGAQAGVGGVNLTTGPRGSDADESTKIGVSEGVGAAARGYWGDNDGDGMREYGFGFDVGPASFDLKTEDPLRAAARNMLPGGALYSDYLLGDGNASESVANSLGLTMKGAGLDSTIDVAMGAYDSASSYVGDGLSGLAESAGGLLDSGLIGGGGLRMGDDALEKLSDLW